LLIRSVWPREIAIYIHPQLKPHFLFFLLHEMDIWIFSWTRDKSPLRWFHMCEPLGKFRFISMRMQIHFGPPVPQNFWHISLGRKTNDFLMSINYALPAIDDHFLFEQTQPYEILCQNWGENMKFQWFFLCILFLKRNWLHSTTFVDHFHEAYRWKMRNFRPHIPFLPS